MEVFDNSDYEKFECADFRTLRRNNKPINDEEKQKLVKNLINPDLNLCNIADHEAVGSRKEASE